MQGIVTKFSPATDSHGSRIVAVSASGVRLAIPYDHGLDNHDAHEKAARALMKKLGWSGKIAGGSINRKGDYAWVFAEGARDPRPRRVARSPARGRVKAKTRARSRRR